MPFCSLITENSSGIDNRLDLREESTSILRISKPLVTELKRSSTKLPLKGHLRATNIEKKWQMLRVWQSWKILRTVLNFLLVVKH